MAGIESKTVDTDESDMRLDRWFKLHFPDLPFGQLQKLLRTGQIRLDGKRAKSETRILSGQAVRLPPQVTGLGISTIDGPLTRNTIRNEKDLDVLHSMLLHEDKKVYVFNKPAGLAVQGGSGVNRHVDGMLEAMRNKKGEKPRLVHRLDRETSGILVVAKTRGAASDLTKAFRLRTVDKTYWAILKGVPRKREGTISTFLLKERFDDGDKMRVARHGEKGADHSVTEYRVIDHTGPTLSWVEFKPITGRTHQLRVHSSHLGHPIIGDPKYFDIENWEFPGGIQKKLHLHARKIRIPHPDGGMLEVQASLPPHMQQTFNLLGLDESDAEDQALNY